MIFTINVKNMWYITDALKFCEQSLVTETAYIINQIIYKVIYTQKIESAKFEPTHDKEQFQMSSESMLASGTSRFHWIPC